MVAPASLWISAQQRRVIAVVVQRGLEGKVEENFEGTRKSSSSLVLGAVLVLTMAMGAFQLMALAVVASDMLDDLNMSKGFFGVATAVNTVVGALFARRSGVISDSIGPKASVIGVLTSAALGMFITAIATAAWMLFLAAFISGFGQGWCNPATNKLIADRVPAGRRGVITGVKQSGVQLGGFMAGLTLPSIANWLNWRAGMAAYGLVALVAGIATWKLLPPDPESDVAARRDGVVDRTALGKPIMLLTGYALLMGMVVGGVGRFLPLFAEDELGMSNVMAGLASALLGGLAIGTRIFWGRIAERHMKPTHALTIQALLSLAAMLLLLAAVEFGPTYLWVMAVVGSLGLNAWNAVAMLAVISGVPSSRAGRASGLVVAGFMAGLSVGGIYTGIIFDEFDSYRNAWASFAVLSAAAAVLSAANRGLVMLDDE
jgi:predicted MFS family arabinose efflux permease